MRRLPTISLLTVLLGAIAPAANAVEVTLSFENDSSRILFEVGSTADSILTVPTSITWTNIPSYDESFSLTFEPTNVFRGSVSPGRLWTFWESGGGSDEFILEDFGNTVDIFNIDTWDDLIALGTIPVGGGFGTEAYIEFNNPSIRGYLDGPMSFSVEAIGVEEVPEPTTYALFALGALACGHAARRRKKRMQKRS